MDGLTRAMQHGEENGADAVKERAALIQQLHTAEQVAGQKSASWRLALA